MADSNDLPRLVSAKFVEQFVEITREELNKVSYSESNKIKKLI
jgi:hypothetical protein